MLTDGRTDGQKSMFFLYYIDYDVELLRARYNLGNYRVRPALAHLYNREKDKPVFPKTINPENIVIVLECGLAEVQKKVQFSSLNNLFFISFDVSNILERRHSICG